jgi:two-component system sensor histidine kinase BaeS
MRLPIQTRLSLSHLFVLLLGMSLAAALAWLAVERLYLDTQRENLLAQARILATSMQGTALSSAPEEPYLQTTNVEPGIHTHVLSEGGAVVIGLPLPAEGGPVLVPAAENAGFVPASVLLQRPEIQGALRGEAATALRRVTAVGGRRVLYAAAPIPAGDGGVRGIVYLATPLPPSGLPTDVIFQLVGAVLAALLLAAAAGALLARRIARPLEDIARAANAVADGDLGRQVPVERGIVELDSLGQAFNAMTAGLRRVDQAKNAFIADVTHELRTPLTVIKGTVETLEDGALDDLEGRSRLLASMARETERLIRLVNELLVLTRADAGALKLDVRPLDLGELARSRCEGMALLAGRRRVELLVEDQTSGTGEGCSVLGDADRLAQVLDNLLDNAVRHVPEGSAVTVTVRKIDGECECAVGDCGPGIPAAHLPLIFERFYRVDASRDRHTGGTGLGLAIARALVLAHGGHITAHSVEGEGTVITFLLPAAKTAIEMPED